MNGIHFGHKDNFGELGVSGKKWDERMNRAGYEVQIPESEDTFKSTIDPELVEEIKAQGNKDVKAAKERIIARRDGDE